MSQRQKGSCLEKNIALALRILPLAIVEKLVKESIGFKDVNDMYCKIRAFMMDENKQAKKKIFENIKAITKEECMKSVGKFLMHG